jgi:WD40 repeat protein
MHNIKQCEVASWKLFGPPTGIAFSPHGQCLHAYDGRYIYTWDVPRFGKPRRLPIDASERSLEGHCYFLGNGVRIMMLASNDDSEEGLHHLTVRDLADFALTNQADVHVETYGVLRILFNRAESRLRLTDCGGVSHFFDFPACVRLNSVKFSLAEHLIYAPDESELWAIRGQMEAARYREYLTAFDPDTGMSLRRLPPDHGAYLDGLRLSPDRDILLVVGENKLYLRDPDSWELRGCVDLERSLRKRWGRSQPALAFTLDGRLLALSCEYNTRVCIVDLKKVTLLDLLDVAEDYCVRLLTFSPDGRFLAIASFDMQREVKVCDVWRMG